MSPFEAWLDRVLTVGESVQDEPPRCAPAERSAIAARLRSAFELHALDVAGPPLMFNAEVAVRAAEVLARACWLLVSGDAGGTVVLDTEAAPAAHLSADVTLRFLPGVYRRARLHDSSGALTRSLDQVLRVWPLSGVLADLDGAPTTAPDFEHTGLQLLYAERLAVTRRSGWVPGSGSARQWVERVFAERGLTIPEPLTETARD